MSYFFQMISKNNQGIIFSNKEYLCEETTKANLLLLALPSFYKIQQFYRRWYSRFSLHISNNEFLYGVNGEKYSFAPDLNKTIKGKYYLIIYANK